MTKISGLWSKRSRKLLTQIIENPAISNKDSLSKFQLLIITQFFPPDYAATGQLIQELAHNLSTNDIQVNVFTGQPAYAYEQQQAPATEIINNLNIRRSKVVQICSSRIRIKALNGIFFTLRAMGHILLHGRDQDQILLTTAPPFLAIAGYVARLLWGTEYTCLIYDLYPDAVVRLGVIGRNHLLTKIWHYVNYLVWGKSNKIIVLTETMKQRIINKHPRLANKIAVIHNWADDNIIKPFPKQKNWFAHQHGIDNQFTVLYSGNMGRCHDLETILGAVKLLRNFPIKFVFIGAGAKYQPFRQAVTKFRLHNCLFLPYQDKNNLPYSLTAGDLALVSIASGLEGIVAPSKLYGIMAAGVAIAAICEPYSYLRSIIKDGECGQCFNNSHSQDLADFILSLAINPQRAVQMGNAARKYLVNNFTPQIIARQYCEVLGIESIPTESYLEAATSGHLLEEQVNLSSG